MGQAMSNKRQGDAVSAKTTKRTPVDIPDSARHVKANFWDEPERGLVLTIARYVSLTGEAHTHQDVTYGPIPQDADVRFLEVFSLDEKFKHDVDRWCVCSACPHDLPQFKNDGVVCWLPREGTIKIVGWDCFKRHNPEAHRKAAARYELDRAKRSDEKYLLARLYNVPILLSDLNIDVAIAHAVEIVRRDFHAALISQKLTDLPRHMKKGVLRLDESKMQISHGTGSRRTVRTKPEYATIKGCKFLEGTSRSLTERLERVRTLLTSLNFGNRWEDAVMTMTDHEKADAAQAFGTALKDWGDVRADITEMRRFLGYATGKTIQAWSMKPNPTYPMFFEFTEAAIRIGMSPTRNVVVNIPVAALEALSVLPDMGSARRH